MIDDYDGCESGWGTAFTGAEYWRSLLLIVITAWAVAYWFLG